MFFFCVIFWWWLIKNRQINLLNLKIFQKTFCLPVYKWLGIFFFTCCCPSPWIYSMTISAVLFSQCIYLCSGFKWHLLLPGKKKTTPRNKGAIQISWQHLKGQEFHPPHFLITWLCSSLRHFFLWAFL